MSARRVADWLGELDERQVVNESEPLTIVCDECEVTLCAISVPSTIQVTVTYRHIPDGTSAEHPLTLETSNGDYAEWLAVEWDRTPLMFDALNWQRRLDD